MIQGLLPPIADNRFHGHRAALWLLGLLGRLWWLRCLVHVWLLVWSVEIYTGRRRWYLALCLKQSRLQIDDIVAQLVVLGLKSLVEFA